MSDKNCCFAKGLFCFAIFFGKSVCFAFFYFVLFCKSVVLFCKSVVLQNVFACRSFVFWRKKNCVVLFCKSCLVLFFAKVWFCSQKFSFVSQSLLVLFAKVLFCFVLQKCSFVRFCGAKVLFYFILVFCFVLLFCFTKVLLNFVM